MNLGRVYTPPTFIATGIDQSNGGVAPHDEYWEGVHRSNVYRESFRPLNNGTVFQHSSHGPIPYGEWSIPLAMNVNGVYTLPLFIVCLYPPCRVVCTPSNDYCTGVHPSNIHCVPLHPLCSGLYPSR